MRQWNGGIRSSGGAVCPKKTKLFLIDFKCNGKDYKYCSIEDMPGDISIRDKDGTMITITRKEPSLANESLGIQLTLTGNQDKQKKVLKKKSEIFAAQVSKKWCNKAASLWTFQYSFMPSLS